LTAVKGKRKWAMKSTWYDCKREEKGGTDKSREKTQSTIAMAKKELSPVIIGSPRNPLLLDGRTQLTQG